MVDIIILILQIYEIRHRESHFSVTQAVSGIGQTKYNYAVLCFYTMPCLKKTDVPRISSYSLTARLPAPGSPIWNDMPKDKPFRKTKHHVNQADFPCPCSPLSAGAEYTMLQVE